MSKPRAGSDLNVVEELESLGGLSAAVRSQFAAVRTGLKRRQLSGAHPCAKATVEVLRNVLGTGGYKNAKEMLHAVRLVGKELSAAAPAELTVGNITRRVMYMIREEYNGKKRAATEAVPEVPSSSSKQKTSGGLAVDVPPSNSVFSSIAASVTSLEETQQQQQQSPSTPSGMGMGVGVPLRRTLSSYSSFSNLPNFGGAELMRMPSVGTFEREKDSQQPSLTRSLAMEADVAEDYMTVFADLRQAVMSAVNELNDEIDNVYSPICDQAQDHIHHDECVLTNGWSYMVEHFLRAAARKRRYHVVVCESSPGLEGHKLAAAICKLPNISVTVIPDSAVYAIMSRINKVVFSPQAVMADGGAICTAGQLNIAVAAKEHHVPVVGLTGAFLLTPMFAHNQRMALGQLLSPASTIPYDLNVCQENCEVVNPSFDYVSPDLIDIYVTNNGSHQPSYMYRLLAEYYNREDHVI